MLRIALAGAVAVIAALAALIAYAPALLVLVAACLLTAALLFTLGVAIGNARAATLARHIYTSPHGTNEDPGQEHQAA